MSNWPKLTYEEVHERLFSLRAVRLTIKEKIAAYGDKWDKERSLLEERINTNGTMIKALESKLQIRKQEMKERNMAQAHSEKGELNHEFRMIAKQLLNEETYQRIFDAAVIKRDASRTA